MNKRQTVKKLFENWSKRILTPLGKITVIKSLALSKLNYIITSLPNPCKATIKTINQLFYKFLWSDKPDKIKGLSLFKIFVMEDLEW